MQEPKHSIFNRMRVEKYSETTIKSYKSYIDKFLYFCDFDFKQEKINDFLNELANKELSASSINMAGSALVYLFEKVLKQPITVEILHARRKNKKPNPLSRENIKLMIGAEKDTKKRACIEFIYSGGSRRFEVAEAKWKNVLWDRGMYRIEGGKGNKDAYILLSKDCLQHLKDMYSNRVNDYIWPNEKQPPELNWHIAKTTPYNWVKDAAKKARITENVYTHRLRASFITHGVENGYPEKYMQKWARLNSRQTMDHYEEAAEYRVMQVRSPLDTLDSDIEREKELRERAMLNTKKVFSN